MPPFFLSEERRNLSLSRLSIITQNKAQATVEELYKDLERRISASPPGLCPVDLASSFLKLCHAQSCGKCVPCRVGLGQLQKLMEQVLDGQADLSVIDLIEKTARNIFYSADCAIGYEAARMVLKGIRGFRDDFEEHILRGRCKFELNQPVPCVSQCPAGVDIPGYVALVAEGRYGDAVRLIRKDNPLPAVCGLICEHPCEVRCRRTMVDDPVNIRGLKRFAVDHAGDVPLPVPAVATGKKVAVIGGGPGGISAAYYLTLMGHEVTIFEQRKKLGGMLTPCRSVSHWRTILIFSFSMNRWKDLILYSAVSFSIFSANYLTVIWASCSPHTLRKMWTGWQTISSSLKTGG